KAALHTSGRRFDTVRAHQHPNLARYPAGGAKNSSAMPSGSRKLSPEAEWEPGGSQKAHPGAVVGVHDAAVPDAELIEAGGPRFQLRTVRTAETDVVEARPAHRE